MCVRVALEMDLFRILSESPADCMAVKRVFANRVSVFPIESKDEDLRSSSTEQKDLLG